MEIALGVMVLVVVVVVDVGWMLRFGFGLLPSLVVLLLVLFREGMLGSGGSMVVAIVVLLLVRPVQLARQRMVRCWARVAAKQRRRKKRY